MRQREEEREGRRENIQQNGEIKGRDGKMLERQYIKGKGRQNNRKGCISQATYSVDA